MGYSVVQSNTVLCSTKLYYRSQLCTTECNFVLQSTTLYYRAQYYFVLQSNITCCITLCPPRRASPRGLAICVYTHTYIYILKPSANSGWPPQGASPRPLVCPGQFL